jgi:endonuclease I
MKRTLMLLALTLLLGIQGFAQTTLPTSWDCDPTTLPSVGWTTNLTDYYNSGSVGYFHSAPASAKFNFTGCHATIFFSDMPATVSYYIRGASFSGGTFSIQESVNGSTWTDLRVFTTNMPTNDLATATPFTDNVNPASRYIRFFYTQKSAGNVAVDDILITKAAAGPDEEIEIKYTNTVIPDGSTYVVGNAASTTLKVINHGTDSTLYITATNFSGTDASMFSVTGMPANLGPEDSTTFTLNFNPTGADGTKTAIMSISNSDSDEDPYVINLWGVKGTFASEPVDNATNLTFTNQKTYEFQVNFSDGSSVPDGYIVMRKTGSMISPVGELPVDGSTYKKGQYLGGAQVAYIGPAGNFKPSFIVASTSYYFAVIPYNGYPGFENYLTASYLAGNTTTAADMIGTYYNSINSSAPTFMTDLHNLINPHSTLYYSDYDDLVVNTVLYRDTLAGGESKKVVTCAYSGENYVYTDPWSWTYFSREHAFCQSWMPTYNDPNFDYLPEYADYHNLRPVNQNSVNAYRSNLPVGTVSSVTSTWFEGKYGQDTAGHIVYEPRNLEKGNVARSMLYMLLCYDGVDGDSWRLPTYLSVVYPYGQDVNVLLGWHISDPVDNWEMAHNDHIESVQNNRNPFIDHPEWVSLINFTTMTPLSISESAGEEISLTAYPNPAVERTTLTFTASGDDRMNLTIYDMMGKLVYQRAYDVTQGTNQINVPVNFGSGVFQMNLEMGQKVYRKKLMVY